MNMSILDRVFGPPDLKKLIKNHDVRGLIRALNYKKTKYNWYPRREEAAIQLGLLKDRSAVEHLIKALKDCEDVRRSAAQALGRIGDNRATEPLVDYINDSDHKTRLAVVKALGELKDPRAINALYSTLRKGDYETCFYAAKALGELKDSCALELLISVLKESNEKTRLIAVNTLGTINDTRLIEPLIDALEDTCFDVRLEAAIALATLRNFRAIEPLLGSFKDCNTLQKTRIVSALRLCNWEPTKDEVGAWYWITNRNWKKCVEIGTPAIKPLLTIIRNDDFSTRIAVINTLGELKNRLAVKPLLALLNDNEYLEVKHPHEKGLRESGIQFPEWMYHERTEELINAIYSALKNIGTPDAIKEYEKKYAKKPIVIKVGMSYDTVISLIGQPRDKGVSAAEIYGAKENIPDYKINDVFYYFEDHPHCDYSIHFSNGEVVSIKTYPKSK